LIADIDVIARDRRHRKSKTGLTTHSTSLRAGYGYEGTWRTFSRKCLASAFTLQTSSGFLSCRRSALRNSGCARNDRELGSADIDVIARHCPGSEVKSVNHPFGFAQGRLRTRRNSKGSEIRTATTKRGRGGRQSLTMPSKLSKAIMMWHVAQDGGNLSIHDKGR
jgi:hypothetical protein